jgi:hypothetical protein
MQVLPATYAELRACHRLGADTFDPRDVLLRLARISRRLPCGAHALRRLSDERRAIARKVALLGRQSRRASA